LSNTRLAVTGFCSHRNSAAAPESAIIGARVWANPPKASNNNGRLISRIANFSSQDTAKMMVHKLTNQYTTDRMPCSPKMIELIGLYGIKQWHDNYPYPFDAKEKGNEKKYNYANHPY
jgi:hypothetical protein